MSLLDTIKGAREEAEQASVLRSSKKDDEAAGDEGAQASSSTSGSFARKSAANARPTRELAGSVRTASSSKSSDKSMSKDERKAKREERRREEDVAYDAAKVVLNQQPGYQRTQRIWWTLMIVGIVCTVFSWLIMRYMQTSGVEIGGLAALSVVLMVAAYVLIIGAFIFDIVKVRPMRKKAEQVMSGMTQKRMKRMLAEDERRKQEERANK